MSVETNGTHSLLITGIAAGGAGVGRLSDGRVVFVHRTAPGDRVEVRLTTRKRRWARARLLDVLEPSPVRRTAPCPHYERCGGCTLEHLEYAAQLEAKSRLVADALQRIAGIVVEPPPVEPSPRELQYRNRVSFTLRRLRSGRAIAGFHEIDAPDRLVDVDGRCLLPEPAIARAWDRLRSAWAPGARRLPAGRELRLTLRSSASGDVGLLVEGGTSAGEPDALLADVPELRSIWHRSSRDERPRCIAGDATLTESWGDEALSLTGGVFLQVNREAAALLEAHVRDIVGDVHGLRVVDAYCGVGAQTRRLARAGASVVGIEVDVGAVEQAAAGAPPGARFVQGTVEDRLRDHLPADLLLLNPPRTGLDNDVTDAIRAAPPDRIIYVSCDPATLARDLGRLDPEYRLAGLRSFDLFPQTAHVETVAELTCAIS